MSRGTRDEQLVAQYRKTRDQQHFEEIHRRYRPQLVKFAANLLASKPGVDLEGIVNATFVAFHEYCLSNKPIRPVRAWLFQGVRLRARDAVRTANRKKRGGGQYTQVALHPQFLPNCTATPAQVAERRDAACLVRKALAELPAEQEQAVRLVYMTGCTLEDAAGRLGISLATAKRRVRSGLDHLRAEIDERIFSCR